MCAFCRLSPRPDNASETVNLTRLCFPELCTPSYSVPELCIPSYSVPELCTPSNSVPELGTPSYSVPELCTPSYSVPELCTPSNSVPAWCNPTRLRFITITKICSGSAYPSFRHSIPIPRLCSMLEIKDKIYKG